jgi:hypothetical protein
MSRLPRVLDNRLGHGDEVSGLTRQPTVLYPQQDSWYLFLLEAVNPGAIMCLKDSVN